MPQIDDYSKEDEDQAAGGGGSRGGGASGGAQLTQATQQPQSAAVPWSRFVSANQDVAARGASALNSQVSGDVSSASKEASDASDKFNQQIESNYTHSDDPRTPTGQPQTSGFGSDTATAFGRPSKAAAPSVGAVSVQQATAPKSRPGQVSSGPQPLTSLSAMPSRTGLKPGAENNPQGSKDLESSVGADAWSKLTGDTTKAQSEAGALGSQTGVQGLIQRQAGQPLAQNGAFDAALEYGQGQKAFGDTSKAGAGLGAALTQDSQQAQNAWHSMMGDVDEAKRQDAATAEADATNKGIQDAWNQAHPPTWMNAAPGASQGGTGGWTPDGYTDLNSFMTDQGFGGQNTVHSLGENLSPADDIWNSIPGAGRRGPTDTFTGVVSGGITDKTAVDQTVRDEFGQLMKEYGADAAQDLWSHMSQDMWNSWLGMNKNDVYAAMKALMDQRGHKPLSGVDTGNAGGNVNSGLQSTDKGYGADDQYVDDDHPGEHDASMQGWLTTPGGYYDQKRQGITHPKKPAGY